MRFIISENRLKGIIEKYLQSIYLSGLCGFWVMDEDKELEIYLIISEDWYFDEGQTVDRNKIEDVKYIKRKVKQMIKNMFGVDLQIYSVVRKCD